MKISCFSVFYYLNEFLTVLGSLNMKISCFSVFYYASLMSFSECIQMFRFRIHVLVCDDQHDYGSNEF